MMNEEQKADPFTRRKTLPQLVSMVCAMLIVQKVYFKAAQSRYFELFSGFVRVLENLESPGILLWHFPGLESPGKRPLVLESSGNVLNSAKNYEVYGRQ